MFTDSVSLVVHSIGDRTDRSVKLDQTQGFVKRVTSLAQKCSDAELMQLRHSAGHGFAGWKNAALLYLRKHMDAEYAEVFVWAEEKELVRYLLGLRRGEFPIHRIFVSRSNGLQCTRGGYCSASRRGCSTEIVGWPSLPHTSIGSKPRRTTSVGSAASFG